MRGVLFVLLAGCGFNSSHDITGDPVDGSVDGDPMSARDGSGGDLAQGTNDLAQGAQNDLASGDLAHAVQFSMEISPTPDSLKAVWASSGGDIYVVSQNGTILHSTGDGTWSIQRMPAANENYAVIGGSGANDIYVGGGVHPCAFPCDARLLHSTGDGKWTALTLPANQDVVWSIGARTPTDVYVSTFVAKGVLHSSDDVSWPLESFESPYQIFPVAADRIYAATGRKVYRRDGSGAWNVDLDLTSIGGEVFATGASSASDIYAAAYDNTEAVIYHSAGNPVWTPQSTGLSIGIPIGLVVVSASEIYAAYQQGILTSSGDGHWTSVLDNVNLNAFWASPDGQLFAVGNGGLILHRP